MEFIRNLLNSEPAVVIAAVSAVIALAVAFGVPISDEQTAAIVKAVGALFGLAQIVLGFAIRGAVFSPASHDEDVAAAAAGAE